MNFPHILLLEQPVVKPYTKKAVPIEVSYPERNRNLHSQFLLKKFNEAWEQNEESNAVMIKSKSGVYLEFKSDPNEELLTKSLEDLKSKKIRLLNIRTIEEEFINSKGHIEKMKTTYATVYVDNDKRNFFLKKIEDYANDPNLDKPKNKKLIESISDISKAVVSSFWTDTKETLPKEDKEWCEIWLRDDNSDVDSKLIKLLHTLNISIKNEFIYFPERIVCLIYASLKDLEILINNFDYIAEVRKAKTSSLFWTDMPNKDQAGWVEDILSRTNISEDTQISVCILDTGINRLHPLLNKSIDESSCLAYNNDWGVHDHHKHGTLMAGVVLYGDLKQCLETRSIVNLTHKLESVKILPENDQNPAELWGHITSQCISKIEIVDPSKKRIFCMAVTAINNQDRGRPSSWSAEIDQICSGAIDDNKRLLILSCGNTTNNKSFYPESQKLTSVSDPAQSWNAIAVGAYTQYSEIFDPTLKDYKSVAPVDGLSPFSSTSYLWDNKWPIKPEVLLEGGNSAVDSDGFDTICDDMSSLSTFFKPSESYFYPFQMTSLSTAKLSWFAAKLLHKYPHYYPETIRGLIIHSADWTPELKRQFLKDDLKSSYNDLLRICGYGVPSLDKAMYCANNSLTLVAQNEIQPFKKIKGSPARTNEMHLYKLPWPKEVLNELPDSAKVTLRITLSYFIEPSPGEIGWKDKYKYPSHGLRFDIKHPHDRISDFEARINAAAEQEDSESHTVADYWLLGQNRNKGSVHSDYWNGTAKELAESNVIAVYPVIGWWRERAHLDRANRKTRYSLIVSIYTDEKNIDIYTPVLTKINIPISIS
jgi:hypothetical protein